MSEYRIDVSKLSGKESLVEKLTEQLKGEGFDVSQKGSEISAKSKAAKSKRNIREMIRRFLHKEGLEEYRVIRPSPDSFLIKKI